jgi:hypothetical protein
MRQRAGVERIIELPGGSALAAQVRGICGVFRNQQATLAKLLPSRISESRGI